MNLAKYKRSFNNTIIFLLIIFNTIIFSPKVTLADTNTDNEQMKKFVENIFQIKSKSILTQDLDSIHSLYDTNTKNGQWAYEYEERKVKYINNWAQKQGVEFTNINPKISFKKAKVGENVCSFYILCNTEYNYIYPDEPSKINKSKIGTYHLFQLTKKDDEWLITKEWYTDPFADSLQLENIKVDSIKDYIKSQPPRDFSTLNERRVAAIEYARKYCGAASTEDNNYKYNKAYRDFNPEGGDCANFASQILHEGGKFKKNSSWNYDKGSPSASWVNADRFTSYWLYSGRASLISKGSYEKVYQDSYKLLPGDFVAYEKKGDITHISVVSGADSKGYTLVTCHNTDRCDVPWDLGWSDKKMKFWLIRVNF